MLGLEESPAGADLPRPRPILGRSVAAALAMAAQAMLSALTVIFGVGRFDLLRRLDRHVSVTREELVRSDALFQGLARLDVFLLLVSATLFLLWFYRAYQNLSAFRGELLEHSPGGAVGSFFIPFLNLFQPFSVIKEIWRGSDPSIPPRDPRPWPSAPTSPLIAVWWGFFLARNVVGSAAMAFAPSSPTLESVRALTRTVVLSHLLGLPSAVAAAVLIFLIQRRQESLEEQLARPAPSAVSADPG